MVITWENLVKTAGKTGDICQALTLGPNTMYGEKCKKQFADPCPVIETPLHGAEAVHSMLLSSRAGLLDVFPARPGIIPSTSVWSWSRSCHLTRYHPM